MASDSKRNTLADKKIIDIDKSLIKPKALEKLKKTKSEPIRPIQKEDNEILEKEKPIQDIEIKKDLIPIMPKEQS